MPRALLVAALAAVAAAACYSIPDSRIAARYRNIYVPTMENLTHEPGLHTRVTEAVRREFQQDGQLRLVNAEADADLVLTGVVNEYSVRASAFDKDDNPLQFNIYVGGDVLVREANTDHVVWRRRVRASDFYQTRRSRSIVRARGREEGLEEAAEEFAEFVVLEFVDSAW